ALVCMTRISLVTPPPGIRSVRMPTGPAPSRARPGRPCSLSATASALRNANLSRLSILPSSLLFSRSITKHKMSIMASESFTVKMGVFIGSRLAGTHRYAGQAAGHGAFRESHEDTTGRGVERDAPAHRHEDAETRRRARAQMQRHGGRWRGE